jgi:ketosteroid isomerase-like protein
MNTLEQRLQLLEDRQALQDTLTTYLVAVDDMTSVDDILNCFTEDVVFDMSGIGYPSFNGSVALGEFFTSVFNTMSHQAHYATNFHIDTLSANTASCRSHVIGKGATNESDEVCFYLQYLLDFQRSDEGWKICSFRGKPLMPL